VQSVFFLIAVTEGAICEGHVNERILSAARITMMQSDTSHELCKLTIFHCSTLFKFRYEWHQARMNSCFIQLVASVDWVKWLPISLCHIHLEEENGWLWRSTHSFRNCYVACEKVTPTMPFIQLEFVPCLHTNSARTHRSSRHPKVTLYVPGFNSQLNRPIYISAFTEVFITSEVFETETRGLHSIPW